MNSNTERIGSAIDLFSALFTPETLTGPRDRRVGGVLQSTTSIPMSLVQSHTHIIIYAEMPGFDKQSIDLDFHSNKLNITGKKVQPVLLEEEKISSSTIRYGNFAGSVKLPVTVSDKEKVIVKYENGVLRIVINLEDVDRNRFKINLRDDSVEN